MLWPSGLPQPLTHVTWSKTWCSAVYIFIHQSIVLATLKGEPVAALVKPSLLGCRFQKVVLGIGLLLQLGSSCFISNGQAPQLKTLFRQERETTAAVALIKGLHPIKERLLELQIRQGRTM